MKKKILTAALTLTMAVSLFSGCSMQKDTAITTPETTELPYYTSEEELPDDAYYIVHDTKEGKIYYPLYNALHTYDDKNESATGVVPSRITWVNYNEDEGLIPTFFEGDSMIYKSATKIPTTYALEKFFDDGYSFGVSGLKQDLSGNYKYDPETGGYVMATSDAAGFDSLQADSIYFVSFKNTEAKKKTPETRVDTSNISPSGTVMGLKPFATYNCDIRTGTEKIDAVLTANIHLFSSAETYMFGSFDFITEHIAKLNIPDYVTTGYYNMNNGGFFRYVPNEKSYDKLTEDDYNDTIYTYNDDGQIEGTTVGLVFDENWFLVHPTEEDILDDSDPLNEGKLTTEDIDTFSADVNIQDISDPMTYATEDTDGTYYEIVANVENSTKFLNLRYYLPNNSTKDVIPIKDGVYSIIYTKDDGSYFTPSADYTYMITSIKEVSVPETTDVEDTSETETTEEPTETVEATETE